MLHKQRRIEALTDGSFWVRRGSRPIGFRLGHHLLSTLRHILRLAFHRLLGRNEEGVDAQDEALETLVLSQDLHRHVLNQVPNDTREETTTA